MPKRVFISDFIVFILFMLLPGLTNSQNTCTKAAEKFYAGFYEAAIKEFKSLKKKEACKDANYLLALCYQNLEKHDSAIKYFSVHLLSEPNHVNAIFQRGICERRSKSYSKALSDFELVTKISPDFFPALFESGNVFSEIHDYRQAITLYENAVKFKPNYYQAFYQSGFCYLQLNDTAMACHTWMKIEELDDFEKGEEIEKMCKSKTQH